MSWFNWSEEPINWHENKSKKNNKIYSKDSYGIEYWKEYDKKNNLIHYKNSNGWEEWREYDNKDD